MKRKTLLLLVSLFASLCMVYQLYILFPDLLDAWNALSELSGFGLTWVREEIQFQFFKVLLGLIFQVCFYGSIAFWSFYEATGKLVDSPFPETKEDIMKAIKPKIKAETIQKVLLIITLVIFIKILFLDILGKGWTSTQDMFTWIRILMIPMFCTIATTVIMGIKNRRNKPKVNVSG